MKLVGHARAIERGDEAFGLIVLGEHLRWPCPLIRLREHVLNHLLGIEAHTRLVGRKRHIEPVAMHAKRIAIDALFENRCNLIRRFKRNVRRADLRLRPKMP